MKKITIPKCRNPFVVILNGIRYEYESGKEIEVPEEIAEVIQFHVDSKPKAKPIIGGGGICNRPHVYFSDGFDKLPTDAVDGSLAVVTESTQSKKFVFNDELDLSTFATNGEMFFVSCGIECDNMNKVAQGSSSWGIYSLSYSDAHNHASLNAYTYNPTGDYGFTHGWEDEAYKTVEIIYANEYVLAWIEANSTYAGIGDFVLTKTTLYSRENGEWVSLGEVDFTNLITS